MGPLTKGDNEKRVTIKGFTVESSLLSVTWLSHPTFLGSYISVFKKVTVLSNWDPFSTVQGIGTKGLKIWFHCYDT